MLCDFLVWVEAKFVFSWSSSDYLPTETQSVERLVLVRQGCGCACDASPIGRTRVPAVC